MKWSLLLAYYAKANDQIRSKRLRYVGRYCKTGIKGAKYVILTLFLVDFRLRYPHA